MTKEEKQILLVDLCARLPYHTIVRYRGANVDLTQYARSVKFVECEPYLRPMNSMTEEEKNELRNLLWFGYPSDDYDNNSHRGVEVKQCLYDDERYSTYDFDDFRALQNFLLKNHFDYCGLIEKGLALEAPEDMYK